MPVPTLACAATVMLLAGSDGAIAQPKPRIDVLTGEPVKPRGEHPRTEPEIFNAPHAPLQERRTDDPPIEIYVTPQVGGGLQQDQLSPGNGRLQPNAGFNRR